MIYIHSTMEIDIDIELTKAKIKLIKEKIAERKIFRSRVKWHEEGEKNNAYSLGLMNSKYTMLDLHKVTDEEGTATDKKQLWKKSKASIKNCIKKRFYVVKAALLSTILITMHFSKNNVFLFSY